MDEQPEKEVVRWLQDQETSGPPVMMPPEMVEKLLQLPPISSSLLKKFPPPLPQDWVGLVHQK